MSVLENFKKIKREGKKLVVVTSYDYWSARILSETDIDGILVGDCSAMVFHGEQDTINSDVETLAIHVEAVAKGAPNKLIIAAMPFLANRKGLRNAMENVEVLMKAGAQAIKIEGCDGNEEIIAHLTQSGIPVIGHIGLTPSHHHMVGGFKVQGKTPEAKVRIIKEAQRLEALGCISLVLEAVPADVGFSVSKAVEIPVVGVGAGVNVDGQGIVLQDMLGFTVDFKPKFVRHYLKGAEIFRNAIDRFVDDVHEKAFPSQQETYKPAKAAPIKQIEPVATETHERVLVA